ncbi:Sulfotransferase family protein [Celeribacter baekdonensis]|uniref:Sulfotransferase family protein n=1 Tax=Celeribacter baekdonensis TaxID=875171 RepID=A0A1G7QC98_9RHOB|nr:sulfotransferase [Celeribacter baekdonensis]SDF96146.1 Sulfotransferase family protein [Celeribacter baekdonensis]
MALGIDLNPSEQSKPLKPNFFLIGAPKCGTTAIAEYLAERDDVFFSKPKEPLFWCTDLGIEPHALRATSLEQYEALFQDADPARHKIIGEGTTSYLRSRKALTECRDKYEDAKFVAILRNPVDVAHAFHMEQVFTGLEREPDFTKAWQDQDRRERDWDAATDDRPDSLLYRRIASFADQIEMFFSIVPEERRKIIIYDDLRADPRGVWLDLLDFLGLPDDQRTDFSPRNAAHAQRFPRLSRFLLAPPKPIAPAVKALRMALLNKDSVLVKTLKGFLNVKRPRSALSPIMRREMTEAFGPDVLRLEALLGTDLSAWKMGQ